MTQSISFKGVTTGKSTFGQEHMGGSTGPEVRSLKLVD